VTEGLRVLEDVIVTEDVIEGVLDFVADLEGVIEDVFDRVCEGLAVGVWLLVCVAVGDNDTVVVEDTDAPEEGVGV